jgi:hypothetical protein
VTVYDAAPTRTASKGQYERVDYSRLSDIIVWLEPPKRNGSAAPGGTGVPQVTHDVTPKTPDPTIHPVTVGQTIVLRNRSTDPIAPYSVSDGNEFELPPIGPGATRTQVVRGEGPIELLVDPAQPPVVLLYAAPSRWVARARSGQTVTFEDVPPGAYRAAAWHPRLPSSVVEMVLEPGRASNATLTVGVDAMADTTSRP